MRTAASRPARSWAWPASCSCIRNIANLVIDADLSCLSVLQYAVDVLKVKHVIVCGHYDCGGVKAAIGDHPHGLVDNWLRHVRDVQRRWSVELSRLSTPQKKLDRLCELNAIQQVMNVGNTTVLQQAWQRGQKVAVHGWMYSIATGLLKDLDVSVTSRAELERMQDRETSAGRA